MSILFAWVLSCIPLGTFIYDVNQSLEISTYLQPQRSYYSSIKIDTTVLPIPTLKPKGNYRKIKQNIKSKQKELQHAYKAADDYSSKMAILDQASLYVTKKMLNDLFPHWYGTTWAFDGYSAIPNEGTIGCSYFVSTTLLHVGFNLNRYQLAQQGPISEARSLALDSIPLSIDLMGNFDGFTALIKSKCKEGLYFIGLGHSHVGYMFYREGEIYFIQSSYGKSGNVVIDYANESDILRTFSNFTLVPITTNHLLIQYWLTGEEVRVVKGKE